MDELISFEGKPSITAAWPTYYHHFYALSAVHEFGRSKYTAFSWQNDPAASNSTIENNIDALMRHISLHKAGYVQDAEGFPHVYHIACRIGMLLTTWYRHICWGTSIVDRPDTFEECTTVLRAYIDADPTTVMTTDAENWIYALHITPEEIISCLKMYTTRNEKVRQSIDKMLNKEMSHEHFIIKVLDLMHLQLMALMSPAAFKSYDCGDTDKEHLVDRQKQYMCNITPCDILQYLSARLHTYIHYHAKDMPHLTRSYSEVAWIIENYKKRK